MDKKHHCTLFSSFHWEIHFTE